MEKSVFESLLEFYLSNNKSISVDRFCHELNSKNLRCDTFTVISTNKVNKKKGIKIINCVYIKDDKYNLNGVYLIDQEEDNNSLAHFLMPISDLNKYLNKFIELDPVSPNCCYYALSYETPKNKKLYNSYARVLLKQQNLLKEKEERQKFKNKILEIAGKKGEEEVAKMTAMLAGENYFSSTQMEYTFLKHTITKLSQKSETIKINQFTNALIEINMSKGANFCQALKSANQVIENSKKNAFKSFLSGANNAFAVDSKNNFNRKQHLIDEIINHSKSEEKTKE